MAQIHGHTGGRKGKKSKTYNSWLNMKSRCNNPEVPEYVWYGAIGIKVCERWNTSFVDFLADMGERPEGTTIDRIDPKKDYEPGNCKWPTPTEQNLNIGIRSDNTSGVKGVFYDKRRKKWYAQGSIYRQTKSLYYGDSYEEACLAREHWEQVNGVRHA